MDEDEVECPHCHKFFLESMLSAHQATCTQAPANRIVFGVIHELSPSGWSFPQEVSDAENATQAWQMYADRFEIVPDFLYVVVSYLQGSIVQGAEPPDHAYELASWREVGFLAGHAILYANVHIGTCIFTRAEEV